MTPTPTAAVVFSRLRAARVRRVAGLVLAAAAACLGCGQGAPAPTAAPLSAAQQEAEAARVFALAQGLEKERKTADAVAAYRHIVRSFPQAPHAKQAAARLKRMPAGGPRR
jgi:hypothetical protein